MVLAPMIGIKCARGHSRNKTRVVQFPRKRQTIRAAIHAALTPMQLPTRVWREFEREQYRSELLVTAVQLLIAALLAVLYASSPTGFSPDAPTRAVPLGLTLLSVLQLVRLYFAVTGQLTRWMAGLSVVAETVVLMFVIWAYHLQYEQPAQFYRRAPSSCTCSF